MLIVSQIFNHFQETILPYLLKRPSPRRMMNKIAKRVHLDEKFKKDSKMQMRARKISLVRGSVGKLVRGKEALRGKNINLDIAWDQGNQHKLGKTMTSFANSSQ